MTDQPTTPSGSRWEPDPDEPADEPADAYADLPADLPAGSAPASQQRRARLRGRAVLAGAATALTVGGGIVGFVIGHSTATDDAGFRPANFSDRGPGGQPGEQGPPGFGDRDGDGDLGQAPPASDGGSTSSNDGTGTRT